jgi:SAM-dependent methyltransferase
VERPDYLSEESAARFEAQSVADAYPYRLPYPPALFDLLDDLITDEPRVVLDIGSGTGDLARGLAPRVDRVDAVDMSAVMIEQGRSLPGGSRANLSWVVGRAEDAPLSPPYALVTAGESLHWMDWERLLPRLARSLTPAGSLALVYRKELAIPWQAELLELIREFSTYKTYRDFDLVTALEARGLFRTAGSATTPALATEQPVEQYISSFFSRASLTREALGHEAAGSFASQLRALVLPFASGGKLSLSMACEVTWGKPLA